tara:strand:+ start:58 stop:747 length:690 start_codon:yes stop_codon:yes gene_type:complete
MSIKRLIILAISLLIVFGVVYLIGVYNPISMELIINQHGQIKNIISEQPILSFTTTIFIVAFLVSIMGPITPICILAGFYFGFYEGLIISIIGETLGAIIVFLYGRYLFKEYFLKLLGERFGKFKDGFNKNAISYLMFIRVVGGTPFGVQNLLPAILDMKLRDYFIATIFGVIPWAYILVSLGNGLSNIVEAEQFDSSMLFKAEYITPLIIIASIVLLPVLYKLLKKRF